jgi:HEAT repeat protein
VSQTPQNADIDMAFEALKTYKIGDDPAPVQVPIDKAVMDVQGNMAARSALERRLVATLTPAYSNVARSFVCRQLALIGTPASVRALAPLVLEEELSVHARNALERIPGAESEKALRDALGQAKGRTRIGVINSIAARRDPQSVSLLLKAASEDPEAMAAAAKALGEIGTTDAAKALETLRGKGTPAQRLAVADALLICAERLIAAGDRAQALKLIEPLTDPSHPAHVRLAANRARSATQRR